jgi:hypothetical protein
MYPRTPSEVTCTETEWQLVPKEWKLTRHKDLPRKEESAKSRAQAQEDQRPDLEESFFSPRKKEPSSLGTAVSI